MLSFMVSFPELSFTAFFELPLGIFHRKVCLGNEERESFWKQNMILVAGVRS